MGTSTHDAMTRLLAVARAAVAPGEHVSVTLRAVDGRSLETAWASSDLARQIDELQYELRQGPCVEAAQTASVCHAVLPEAEQRWPDLIRKMETYAVGSVLSTPLRSPGGVLGALNVYSSRSEPFGDEPQAAAREVADLAAAIVALSERATARHLADVAESRDLIVRAQGVIMAWQGCPPDEAFAILRRTSTKESRRLRDVAADVLASVQQSGG